MEAVCANLDFDSLTEHSGDPAHMWRSAKGETSCWLEFDLGEVQSLGSVCIWNYNDAWHADQGVRKMDLSVWTQEAGWKKIQEDYRSSRPRATRTTMSRRWSSSTASRPGRSAWTTWPASATPTAWASAKCSSSQLSVLRPSTQSADGVAGVNVGGLELRWVAGEGAKTHQVHFGVSPDDLKPLGGVAKTSAKLSQLSNDAQYYWRVDEVRADSSIAAGKVWSFTTRGFEGWWKLDEVDGTKVADSSGNGHDGMITAAARGSPRMATPAARFNSTVWTTAWKPAGSRICRLGPSRSGSRAPQPRCFQRRAVRYTARRISRSTGTMETMPGSGPPAFAWQGNGIPRSSVS